MFYRGDDIDRDTYGSVIDLVSAPAGNIDDTKALARAAAVSATKLNALVRAHGHTTPAALLRRSKVQRAMQHLIEGDERITDIAYTTGFDSESTFHRQFVQQTALSPGAYRALRESTYFVLRLPPNYRFEDPLGYHGRDPLSKSEIVRGRALAKALMMDGQALRLIIALEDGEAACQVECDKQLGPAAMAAVHAIVLRMLGLTADPASFESFAAKAPALAPVVAQRRGLRIPLTATNWEALAWAIIGQQINLPFACALRRELVELAGASVRGGMIAHPDPQAVASLETVDLTKRRFSSSKARYLIGAARAVVAGELDLASLSAISAPLAAAKLTALAGVGPWTANYTLMRGAGFADCAPIGDSALSTALARLHSLRARPDAAATARLMERYAPYRSFATAHLWASLADR